MRIHRIVALGLLAAALPALGCQSPPDSPLQAGEPFAEVMLEFES